MSKHIQYDVFISYNSDDKILVNRLSAKLREKSLHVWLDRDNLHAGDSLPESIRHAISNSRVALFCISENGLGKWQKDEIEKCEALSRNERLNTICVLLCDQDELPDELDYVLTSSKLYSRWDNIIPERTEYLIQSIFEEIKIWREKELIRLLKARDDTRSKLLEVEKKIEQIEQEFFVERDPKRQELLSFLAAIKNNVDRHVKKTLKNFPKLELKIRQDGALQEFCYNLEAFVELIEISFRAREMSILHDPHMIDSSSKFYILEFSSEEEEDVYRIYQKCLRGIADLIPSSSINECTDDKDNLENYFTYFSQKILPFIWV